MSGSQPGLRPKPKGSARALSKMTGSLDNVAHGPRASQNVRPEAGRDVPCRSRSGSDQNCHAQDRRHVLSPMTRPIGGSRRCTSGPASAPSGTEPRRRTLRSADHAAAVWAGHHLAHLAAICRWGIAHRRPVGGSHALCVVFLGGADFDPPPPLGTTDRARYIKVTTLEEALRPDLHKWIEEVSRMLGRK
jgi:hypothetical protein